MIGPDHEMKVLDFKLYIFTINLMYGTYFAKVGHYVDSRTSFKTNFLIV